MKRSPAHLRAAFAWPLLIIAVTLVAAVIGHSARLPAATPDAASAPPAIPVTVATAVRADVPVRLSALGSVVAFNTVTVRPRVDGQLMRVTFQEGQFVKQGDLLAEIDPRPFEVQLEQAEGQLARDEAQLANARVDLARYQTLLSEDSIARQNVDSQASTVAQLQGAITADQAAVDGARLNLTYTRVTAPASGRVGLRLVDPGNIVSASSATGLVVVTQIEPIAVVFTLPEDALRIVLPRIRSRATLPVDVFDRSGTTRLASGTVVTLDNQIDPATGTVRVKAVFDNRDRTLFQRSSSTCSCSPTFGGDSSSYRPPPCSRDPRVHSCIPFAAETPSCSRSRRFQSRASARRSPAGWTPARS